jgi:hypothetical protein
MGCVTLIFIFIFLALGANFSAFLWVREFTIFNQTLASYISIILLLKKQIKIGKGMGMGMARLNLFIVSSLRYDTYCGVTVHCDMNS